LNNLGVARAWTGHETEARDLFSRALARFPAFRDSRINLDADHPVEITTHPLRAQPQRQDYSAHVEETPAAHR
jgi:hypothetical protein